MLMFLKENCDVTINPYGCLDRRKQHEKYDNADATSPTVSTESVLIYAVVDTYKERDVAVVNIPEAYRIVDMDYNLFMIFWDTMAYLMVASDHRMY